MHAESEDADDLSDNFLNFLKKNKQEEEDEEEEVDEEEEEKADGGGDDEVKPSLFKEIISGT